MSFFFALTISPQSLIALDIAPVAKAQEVKLTNKEYTEQLITKYAAKYGVSRSALSNTIKNENGNYQFDRQSLCKYKAGNRWGMPAGSLEKSYGLAMIHLPDHPDITYKQAIDPEFAVDYMAKEFSKGHQGMWMGYQD